MNTVWVSDQKLSEAFLQQGFYCEMFSGMNCSKPADKVTVWTLNVAISIFSSVTYAWSLMLVYNFESKLTFII